GPRRGRHREPEAAEVVVHVVVRVPAAVLLAQVEREERAAREAQRPLRHEDGLAVLVAPAGARVDAPRGVILAVDRVLDGARHALLAGEVVEVGLEVARLVGVIRGRPDDLSLRLLPRLGDAGGLDAELGERARPHEAAPGAAAG